MERLQSWAIGAAKIFAPSFKNILLILSMPGALEISRDVSILCTDCSDVGVKLKNDSIF